MLRAHACCVCMCVCVCASEREKVGERLRERICVCVCVCTLLTRNQSCGGVIMILAPFPEGSSLTAPGSDFKLPHFCREKHSPLPLPDMQMTLTEAEEMVRFCFSHSDVGRRVISISPRQGVILSEREPGLSHTWMDSLHGSRPLKSVWVISCQRRGEQQQIGLLKQFSSTGGLLSACQQPDYSIQFFCCSQSGQSACGAGPHSYLSIPDAGINTSAPKR